MEDKSSDCPTISESLAGVLQSAHVGNDTGTWRDVIGRKGFAVLKSRSVVLLNFCACHSLSLTKNISPKDTRS